MSKLNVITSDVINRVHSSKVTWGKPFATTSLPQLGYRKRSAWPAAFEVTSARTGKTVKFELRQVSDCPAPEIVYGGEKVGYYESEAVPGTLIRVYHH
jgi:hypothetical protein